MPVDKIGCYCSDKNKNKNMLAISFLAVIICTVSQAEGFYIKEKKMLSNEGILWNRNLKSENSGQLERTDLGLSIDKKNSNWGLSLQPENQEIGLLELLGSRSVDHFLLNTENLEELRTGRLSITNNLDILRQQLVEAIRRNRARKEVGWGEI